MKQETIFFKSSLIAVELITSFTLNHPRNKHGIDIKSDIKKTYPVSVKISVLLRPGNPAFIIPKVIKNIGCNKFDKSHVLNV